MDTSRALDTERVLGTIVTRLIHREGGYVDDPRDAGGCTKYGITRGGWLDLMGYPITCEELKALTIAKASEFYLRWGARHNLWVLVELDAGLCEIAFDTSVLFGPGRAVKWLQLEAGSEDDGFIGDKTLAAIRQTGVSRVGRGVLKRRILSHANKVSQNPSQVAFLMGWMRRCTDLMDRL